MSFVIYDFISFAAWLRKHQQRTLKILFIKKETTSYFHLIFKQWFLVNTI